MRVALCHTSALARARETPEQRLRRVERQRALGQVLASYVADRCTDEHLMKLALAVKNGDELVSLTDAVGEIEIES